MRIGIVTGEYPPMQGGVGAYSSIIACTLAEQGHEVFVFSSTDAHEDDPALHLTNTVNRWRYAALRHVKRWAQTYRLDVVNLQFETAAYAMSSWIHLLPDVVRGVPVVTTFHDLLVPYLFPKAGPLRDWIVMRLARASAGVIATNHEDMTRLEHLPHARLIPIGSNITPTLPPDHDREAIRRDAGIAPDDFVLAHFGFINHSKGIETLLRAASLLRAADFPATLVMIGGRTGSSDPTNATYANEIDGLIDKLDLKPHIHWTGFVDDAGVSAYLDMADAVVLPFRDGASYRRGSLMAALQHGCDIITTQPVVDVPAFKHGENMLLFPSGNIEALMALIRKLHAGQHPHIGEGARQLASHFDWANIAAGCVSLFNEVSR